ncbi:GntR family transcriptional regulator [Rubellicoccus peritrichatus]|uniref:GntR family transcriptional regulator n=1 Tax=Rubellicoccus peritrichatus TaxID=3080537 RepID=A0AAQ3LFZ2_9BACT|nr:GntR family transcriptional regulator [Puniceicoccus sp. CR14]WOO43108.1 GntR family transcriptional regulator [Puniceicoccus sp. CR14]
MTTLSKPKSVTLADQIYAELKRRMLTCELAPGARLIEKHLCEELGVSRASLREGLNRLMQERLVTLKPNCGFSVTPITLESFANVCEMRRVVESAVAALAAERASEADIAEMRRAAVVDCAFNAENAHIVYCESNRAFHSAIAQSIDNLLLEDTVLAALDKDQQPLYYGIDIETCTNPVEVSNEHNEIVDAIEARLPEEARKLMSDHIGKKEDRIIDALRGMGLSD